MSFMSIFTSSLQIPVRFPQGAKFPNSTLDVSLQVQVLAKSMRKAGELGTLGIPESMKTTESRSGLSFTVLGNSQALSLAGLA